MAKNKYTKRVLDENWDTIKELKANGTPIKDIAIAYGVSRQVLEARFRKKAIATSVANPTLKILTLDIENAPMKAYVWGLWQQDIQQSMRLPDNRSYMMSVAAKWLHEDKVHYFETRNEDDSEITAAILKMVDEADIVVGHNAKRFDMKKINAYAILNNLPPPSPYRVVDTMLIARKHFAFERNTLEYLSKKLCKTPKLDHKEFTGFELWSECISGNEKAWEEMKAYNIQDVVATEELYLILRPWAKGHPNVVVPSDSSVNKCTACGSTKLVEDGFFMTNAGKFKQYKCTDCGSHSRGRKSVLTKDAKNNLLAPVTGM